MTVAAPRIIKRPSIALGAPSLRTTITHMWDKTQGNKRQHSELHHNYSQYSVY